MNDKKISTELKNKLEEVYKLFNQEKIIFGLLYISDPNTLGTDDESHCVTESNVSDKQAFQLYSRGLREAAYKILKKQLEGNA